MVDIYTKAKRSEIMARVRSRSTRPEILVRRVVHGLGFRFRLASSRELLGKPDLVLGRLKTVLFVHGCFWHGHDCAKGRSKPKTNAAFWSKKIGDNVERDYRTVAALQAQGWRVAIIWECQTKDIDRLRSLLADELTRA